MKILSRVLYEVSTPTVPTLDALVSPFSPAAMSHLLVKENGESSQTNVRDIVHTWETADPSCLAITAR